MKNKAKLGFLLLLLGCGSGNEPAEVEEPVLKIEALPYYNTPDFEPIWEVPDLDQLHQVSAFSFTDQNGKKIDENTVENKIYITNFFFTSCGSICPKMMGNMEYLQHQLADREDVLFLSHSVTPDIDSVEKLNEYCKNFKVNHTKWHLLTGDKTQIYTMARKSYFAEEEPGFGKDSTEFLHTEHFILVDKQRHLRGIYNGTVKLEMDRIVEDVELLLNE